MDEKAKHPPPFPEEDLGRGGEASAGVPAGSPGEREELGRDTLDSPRGPGQPEQALPPSAKR